MTEYTVYTCGQDIILAEDESVASLPPWGSQSHLVTTDQDEAVAAIEQLVRAGYRWSGNEWLEAATFHCNRCGLPAEPNGQGGFRHMQPADDTACSLISGGGMLAALLDD